MNGHIGTNILLVCSCEDRARVFLDKLHDAGFHVLGPAVDAATALALASQTHATIALVASKPTGRRKALELADALQSTWGIPSWIFPEAAGAGSGTRPGDSAGVLWSRVFQALGVDPAAVRPVGQV
jgi:hypothetical protein